MEATDDLHKAAEGLLIHPEKPAKPEPKAKEPEVEEAEVEEEETSEAPEEEPTEEEPAEAAEAEEEEAATDDDEADDAGPEGPVTYTVKVDGKAEQVTLEDLQRSYSGNAHIQRGMQEAAEAKKQAQAILEALQAEQQRFTAFAQQAQTEGFLQPPKAPDPKLAKTDPIGFIEAQAEYQTHLEAYQSQQAELQRYAKAQNAMTKQQLEARKAEQAAILAKVIPDYADPQKGAVVRESLRKTGAAYGYSEQELNGIDDARAVQVLHDAMQWRKLQSAKQQVKKDPPAPKNVKPAGKRPEPPQLARKRAIEKAKQTGDLRDWAATLLE